MVIRAGAGAALVILAAAVGVRAAERPNIVFLLADDLGYGDVACYGCPDIRTPSVDRLAGQGVRFTQFYANAPECTPTRCAFITGRWPQRVGGLECAIGVGNVGRYDDAERLAGQHDLGLPPSDTELPVLLKKAGYATGILGKWHLGYEPKFLPRKHGFDYFFGPLGGFIDYFKHDELDGHVTLYRNEEPADVEGYSTDLIADEAIAFMKSHKAGPFFLYVPFNAPHEPIQDPDTAAMAPSRATYVKMVERLDGAIGKIVKAVDDEGLAGNTLVVFSSDNGGTAKFGRNLPFSRGKGTTYEGGIREPCIVRWPGVFKAGVTTEQVGITMDLTASFVRLAGAEAPTGAAKFDGIDVLKLVQEGAAPVPRALFWRLRRGENTRCGARDGSWKLVVERKGVTVDGKMVEEHLFDLDHDLAEKHDLMSAKPAEAARMKALLADWEKQVKPSR